VAATPEHTDVGDAEALTVGLGLTIRVMDAGFAGHPELVPVTVYEVVTVGLTTIDEPFSEPGDQV
jgi:hypothetical protein